MNFRQLEAFISVVKYRSFSKAAEAIYISQPTVSVHINALEDELGVPLIIRAPKGIFPTEAGKIFYTHAMQILKTKEKSIDEIHKYSNKICGSLEIAASTVPAQYIIPEILPKISLNYPDIFLSVNQFDSVGVVEKVDNMEIEVGICGTKTDKQTCDFTPFLTDELVIITPNTPEYSFLNTENIMDSICKLPFISREKGSGTRTEMENIFEKSNISTKDLKIITQLESTESVKQAVKNGLGISVVSKFSVRDFLEFNKILALSLPTKMERNFYLVTRKTRPLSRQAEIFIDIIKTFDFK